MESIGSYPGRPAFRLGDVKTGKDLVGEGVLKIGVRQETRITQHQQKSLQLLDLLRGEGAALRAGFQVAFQIRTIRLHPHAVVLKYFIQGGKATVVHIGRRILNIPERRHAKLTLMPRLGDSDKSGKLSGMENPFSLGRRRHPLEASRGRWLLAALLALALAHCGGEDRESASPASTPIRTVCGDSTRLLSPNQHSFERAKQGAAWLAPRARQRYISPPLWRQVQTGFYEVPIFDKIIEGPGENGIYIEFIELDASAFFGAELRLAPRVRLHPDEAWKELGWLDLESEDERWGKTIFRVPFDLVDENIRPDQPIEIGLSVFASFTPTEHSWESPILEVTENSVLSLGLGLLEPGRDEGFIAWRILACEDDLCECVYEEIRDSRDAELEPWTDRYLSLADWAGRSPSFRLETQSLGEEESSADSAVWSTPVLLERRDRSQTPRKNLLVISLDTLGADHLGLYGYERDTSPFIDEVLFAQSTVFMEAAAPATTTGPSHMTLFTSLPPSVHGFVSNVSGTPLPEAIPTLAEILVQAGYLTVAVTENGAITDKARLRSRLRCLQGESVGQVDHTRGPY